MFADGLVDEVRMLLGRGLRDGVTASRALGYAQVIDDLDSGGDGSGAREPTSSAPAATCDGSGRGSGAITGSPGSRGRAPTPSTTPCGRGDTYPDQVMFTKGHGTQNDFVVLPDLEGALICARRGRRAVRPASGTRRRRRAAGGQGGRRCRRCPRPAARRRGGGRLVHGLPQRRRLDRADVRQRRSGVRALPARHRPGEPRRVRRRLVGWARGRSSCTAGTQPTADVTVEMGKTNQLGTGEAIVGGRTFTGLAVDVGNPHLACVDPDLTADGLAALDVAAPAVRHRPVP